MALFVAVVTARLLGPAGAGVVQLAQTLGNQLALVLSLGTAVSLVRAVACEPRRTEVFTAALLLLGILVPIFAVAALGAPQLARLVVDGSASQRTAFVLAVPLGWLFLAQDFAIAAFRGRNLYRQVARLLFGAKAATAGALAVVLLTVERSAEAAVSAVVVANAVVALVFVAGAVRAFGFTRTGAGHAARRLVRFNLRGHIGTVLQELSYRFDLFLVAALVSTAAAGVYSVASVLCTLLWYIPTAIGTVLLSRLANAGVHHRSEILVLASQVTMAMMAVVGVVALAVAPVAVPALFGERFGAAVPVFAILIPGVVLLSVWKVVANGLAGLGYPSLKLPSAAAGAAAGVVLDFLLIPSFGIRGAAAAATVAYTVTTLLLLRPAAGVLGVPPTRLLRPDVRGAVELLRSALGGTSGR